MKNLIKKTTNFHLTQNVEFWKPYFEINPIYHIISCVELPPKYMHPFKNRADNISCQLFASWQVPNLIQYFLHPMFFLTRTISWCFCKHNYIHHVLDAWCVARPLVRQNATYLRMPDPGADAPHIILLVRRRSDFALAPRLNEAQPFNEQETRRTGIHLSFMQTGMWPKRIVHTRR